MARCEEKRKMTEAVATQVIESARTNRNAAYRRVLFSYQCPQCGFWHMTKNAPRPTQTSAERYAAHYICKSHA